MKDEFYLKINLGTAKPRDSVWKSMVSIPEKAHEAIR